MFRGRPRAAESALREADLLLGTFDYGLRRGVVIWLAMAAALAGDTAAAEAALADAQKTNRSRARLYDADWARARAWTLAAAGQQSAAELAIDEAAAVAVEAERWTYEMLALHDKARLGGAESARAVVGRLDELAGIIDGRLAAACAAHARALSEADGQGLDQVAADFSELGFDLFAAEAQASAVEAHRRAGRTSSAHAAAERAGLLAAGCEGASTPALRSGSTFDQGLALTRRERETAELAARGLTDRQIAEALFLSVRTVHAHLRSAYAKLGISGRGELGGVLGIQPK